jgi:hypothetical protein
MAIDPSPFFDIPRVAEPRKAPTCMVFRIAVDSFLKELEGSKCYERSPDKIQEEFLTKRISIDALEK